MAKPFLDTFAVVTATTSPSRSAACRASWRINARFDWAVYTIANGGETEPYLGVVPAFAKGVDAALAAGHTVIACLHDDLLIDEPSWDERVIHWFETHPSCGLAGFGGGVGLGDADLYQKAYAPYQLARQGFVSNMRDAEAHGRRSVVETRVACLDGFSLVGRREFWLGQRYAATRRR